MRKLPNPLASAADGRRLGKRRRTTAGAASPTAAPAVSVIVPAHNAAAWLPARRATLVQPLDAFAKD